MKTIIAGSRTIHNYTTLEKAIKDSEFRITMVLCGMADGVDDLGRIWAIRNGIPIAKFPANWKKYGRGAGYRRNREMCMNADAAIFLWDGKSKGTENTIGIARELKIPIHVVIL